VKTSTQLNAKLRNLAHDLNVDVRVLRQNFMLERFLERVSLSAYRDAFVVKGGVLIAALIGIGNRATVDLDATLTISSMELSAMRTMLQKIIETPCEDQVRFSILTIEGVLHDGGRAGYKIVLEALFDQSRDTVKLDVSIGDVITPGSVGYGYRTLFDDRVIPIRTYNVESVLAEKFEAILSLNVLSTRMKDFYDVTVLLALFGDKLNKESLAEAIRNTCKQRGSEALITEANIEKMLRDFSEDNPMEQQWKRYQQKNRYISIGEAAKLLGVSITTLRRWDKAGRLVAIKSPSGHRRYKLADLKPETARERQQEARKTIAYARVSSSDQKRDLERQKQVLELHCASKGWVFELVSDLGSGMNYHKKGLKYLLNSILNDSVGRLVITHKDRLLRFGAELVFAICEAKHVEVVILNQDEESSFEEDLAEDVLEIITVFSARLYGSRSRKNQKLIEEVTKAVERVEAEP